MKKLDIAKKMHADAGPYKNAVDAIKSPTFRAMHKEAGKMKYKDGDDRNPRQIQMMSKGQSDYQKKMRSY